MIKPIALVVEDNSLSNVIFSAALQDDFHIETCTNGTEAIHLLDTINPTLVILDLNLPGASGGEVLQHIRSNQRLAHTRVIITTGDEPEARKLRHMADHIMVKPISPIELREYAARFAIG